MSLESLVAPPGIAGTPNIFVPKMMSTKRETLVYFGEEQEQVYREQ